jgi:hypothetical protein
MTGISYLLSNGKNGTITDPRALRAFYTRLFYARLFHGKAPKETKSTKSPR